MNCPTCIVELRIADRQGIEIDYCPQCRGVWLERGELDKIIERSLSQMTPRAPEGASREYRRDARDEPRYDQDDRRDYRSEPRYDRDDDREYPHERRRRRSFLDDLFDFD